MEESFVKNIGDDASLLLQKPNQLGHPIIMRESHTLANDSLKYVPNAIFAEAAKLVQQTCLHGR